MLELPLLTLFCLVPLTLRRMLHMSTWRVELSKHELLSLRLPWIARTGRSFELFRRFLHCFFVVVDSLVLVLCYVITSWTSVSVGCTCWWVCGLSCLLGQSFYFLCQGGCVIAIVCLLVCLWTWLHKKFSSDFSVTHVSHLYHEHDVRLSVMLAICDHTVQCTAYIHERAINLVFWHRQWLVGDAPFV